MTTLENQPDLPSPPTVAAVVDMTPTTVIGTRTVTSTPLTPEQAPFYARCRDRYVELEELLEFAVENGLLDPLSLAAEVKSLKSTLYYMPESAITGEQLCQVETSIEMLYTKIAQLVAPVTIDTLRATSDKYPIHRPWWVAWLLGSGSLGRNFLRQLFWVGGMLLLVMLVSQYIMSYREESVLNNSRQFLAPFFYGAVGAWIYLYRTLTNFYLDSSLNPKESSTYWLRLCIGALAGGLIVHFLLPEMQIVTANSSAGTSGVVTSNSFASQAAIGLLGGYSVDFFYNLLDRLIQALLPKDDPGTAPPPTAKQMQMEALLKRLHDADSEEDKATIRRMLEKL